MRAMIALWIVAVLAGPAIADNRTEAILLFDQGIKEMKAGQFEKACNSFERSIAIYPDSGTKGSLAMCYEKLNKLASSWLLWRELADLAPSAELRKDAASHAKRLEPRVAHYLVKISAATPGLALTINGKPTALTDIPVPIDAGAVIARAYATGRKDWSEELTAVDGETLTIEVPELVAVDQRETDVDPHRDLPPPPPPPPPHGKRKLVGLVLAGAGGAMVIAGGVFGFKARGKFADAEDTCGGSIDACNAASLDQAQQQVDDARSAGNVSTLLFVAGGVAVAGGIVLYVTAPTTERRVALQPIATPTTTGLALSGRF